MIRRFLRAYGELVLIFGLGALAQLELWLDAAWAADRRELAPLALAMTAVLLLRVRRPLLTAALLLAAFQVESALLVEPGNDPMGLVILFLVGIYSAGAHTRGRASIAATVLVAVAIVVGMYEDGESMNVSGLLFFGFFIGSPFLAGVVIRMRRERETALVDEREERARAAVAEERARIARELHDIVAHAIGVVVVQARGARHALDRKPEDARRALDAIEATSTDALAEMRRLLGVLRSEDDELALAPQPGLSGLEALATQVRQAGLPTEVHVAGEPRELPPGVDLSAYRIVQEGLTNALKHAGPHARARVVVRYGDDELELEVRDDGAGSANGAGGGHGLTGMRERVSIFGGELESGPAPEGGFAVRARLPL